ncbi:MAG: UDP-4-amino-4,6-dideoxy-N-acetyl-beta-L-altrosamine transaminase [Candidatus ainarchaeum sp.]|nr:UDP-4-amino-4,6-dideoxy-N-acetyl-beta-L-altrosamine transaminase [Candidatus ainarchaeum sp.]MDD5096756.1 UDP-4-amino-4,6-dideoxy-N-acetyl-beta-L-altrosamine transaminase [Candidatus ainarchaeum sp.]
MPNEKIPYGKQDISEEDVEAVVEVLRSDRLTTGPKVELFEKGLCDYVGASHAVAVNSGTSALDIAAGALELTPGSEIITTPFTFAASSNCILYNNCKPVFADIDPKTYNIDPAQIRKKITRKTKAIIYVDYAGQPCDIKEIKEIADEHDLSLIEDACHALGAEYGGKRVGSFADMTVFSFHPVKHITTGEGGAVATDDEGLHHKLKLLRNHGIDKAPGERTGYTYDMKMLGRNYRITDFQCALGLSQLKRIEGFLSNRNRIAKIYGEEFGKLKELTVPYVKKGVRHAWHLYTILLDKRISRDRFFECMRGRGIGVNVHYIPIYRFSYYKQFGIRPEGYPVTEDVYSRTVTLPLFPKMGDGDAEMVISAVKGCLGGH